MLIKFGIIKRDKYTIFIISICTKLVNVSNLVNCSSHEIDKKIKKIKKKDFSKFVKIYLLILLNIFKINF